VSLRRHIPHATRATKQSLLEFLRSNINFLTSSKAPCPHAIQDCQSSDSHCQIIHQQLAIKMSHSSDEDWIEVSDAETGPSKGKRDLTDLAKRYTHPTGRNHATLANTGKSGLTPIPPYPENRPLPSQTERERIAQLEAYQMWRFLGFRIQNLVEMEAFAPSYKSDLALYEQFRQGSAANFKGLGANVPVHPLFSRNKWAKACFKSRPWYLLPGGKSGHWQVTYSSNLNLSRSNFLTL
jgi:hypothetical protein